MVVVMRDKGKSRVFKSLDERFHSEGDVDGVSMVFPVWAEHRGTEAELCLTGFSD